jgi:hypothetical protein
MYSCLLYFPYHLCCSKDGKVMEYLGEVLLAGVPTTRLPMVCCAYCESFFSRALVAHIVLSEKKSGAYT